MLEELRAMEDRILADADARERYARALIAEIGTGAEPCATIFNDVCIEMNWHSASTFLIELVQLTPKRRYKAARWALENA